ncbi:MAG TPA: amino acid ABC transporter permease [Terriglobales bacterium]|nr:amino acid ABC transporter permease [Terriglobales bacterium]
MTFWDTFLPQLFSGALVTVELIVVSVPIGVALAILLGVARVYGNKPISLVATTVVGTFRGLPAIVTLFIIFFALPDLGIYFSSYWSAVIGFVLVTGAYQSEYVRGSIQSVESGQSLAAQSLGMSRSQEVLHIILPQAIRAALPGISNEVIYLVLYSSLASYIGVQEMFGVARTFNSLEFRPIEIFLTAGLLYAALATVCFVGFRMIERRLRIPGLEIAK